MARPRLSTIQSIIDAALAPLRAFTGYDDEDNFLDPSPSSQMASFIRANFQKKVCSNFVAAQSEEENSPPGLIMCVCGSTQKDHPNVGGSFSFSEVSFNSDSGKYIVEELKPTDAFGQIKFLPQSISYQEPAEYVRLADTSDPGLPAAALKLMQDFWNLAEPEPPSLVISLAPSGHSYCLSDQQSKEIFNRGLIKAIKSTNGWLITGGLNMGVAKAVGSAVSEGQTLDWNTSQDETGQRAIKCIGIASWDQVQNRELLTNKNPNRPNFVDYLVDPAAREGEPVSLNPNHSHFLLVDVGLSTNYNVGTQGNAEFRADLEKQIALPKDQGGLDVPVVCLMVEGSISSLEQVLNSVKQGLPAVICAHSGGAANVLAWALEQYKGKLKISDGYQRDKKEYELRVLVKERTRSHEVIKKEDGDTVYDAIADIVVEICDFHEQITIFRIGENHSLDEALLLSILDSQHKADPLKQLQLAQRWGRADVAKQILTDPRYFFLSTNKNVDKLMISLEKALIDDQVNFVRLYLDSGVPINRFLTAVRLRGLYAETLIGARYLWKCFGLVSRNRKNTLRRMTSTELADKFDLTYVNSGLISFGRRFRKSEYDEPSVGFAEPLHHLFIWSVLLNREDLAILFWERCSNPIDTAIAGTVLCKYLCNLRIVHESLRVQFAHFKLRLEKLACGLVKEAVKQNMSKAALLVKRPSPRWGNLNCMALAGIAEDQKFLATECCQTAIKNTWKKGYSASFLQIFFSTLLFIPIFTVVQFDRMPPLLCRCPAGGCNCRRNLKRTADESHYINLDTYTREFRRNSFGKILRKRTFASNINGGTSEYDPDFPTDGERSCLTVGLWLRRIFIFYYSPAVKFVTHTFFYCAYLFLYAYVLLFCLDRVLIPKVNSEGPPDRHRYGLWYWQNPSVATAANVEKFLYFWQATLICEEIRIIFWHSGPTITAKLQDWWVFSSLHSYNRFRLVSYALSIIIVGLRNIESLCVLVKALLVLNFVTYVTQIFKVYSVNGYLGPKVFMMKRMIRDLIMFILVFMVFYACYSVSYHSFYKSANATAPSILKVGIWEIFGEVDDDSILAQRTKTDCHRVTNGWNMSGPLTNMLGTYIGDECAIREGLVLFLLIVYLFCTSILLVNMLIATFTYTFDNIQKNSKEIWKFQMYFLVEEYRTKPILPEPLIVIEHGFLLIRHFVRMWTKRVKLAPAEVVWDRPLTKTEKHFLNVFESACRADYLERKKRKCACTCGRCNCHLNKKVKDKQKEDDNFADM